MLGYSYSGRTAQAVKVLAAGRTCQNHLHDTGCVSREDVQMLRKLPDPANDTSAFLRQGKPWLASVDDQPTESERSTRRKSQAEGIEIRTLGLFGINAPLRLHGIVLQRLRYERRTPLLRRKVLNWGLDSR